MGARVTRLGTKSFDMEHEIRGGDGRSCSRRRPCWLPTTTRRTRPWRSQRTGASASTPTKRGALWPDDAEDLREDDAPERPAGPDRRHAAGEVGRLLRDARCGSRYETKDTNGIAHFAEHMFFKGTRTAPRPATSPARSTRSAASSTPSPARSTPATTSSARPSTATRRSTSSSTCSATPSSTPRRSSARRA